MSEWQPIETAPEADSGKTMVLVFYGNLSRRPIEIRQTDGVWWRMEADRGSNGVPTHWMPMPEPPQ